MKKISKFMERLMGLLRVSKVEMGTNKKEITSESAFLQPKSLGVKGKISRSEIYDYLDDPTRHPYPAGEKSYETANERR